MCDLLVPRPGSSTGRAASAAASTPLRHHREQGQAATLLLVCVTFITLAAVGAGELGARMVARQRARAAADAAALAATSTGRAGALRLASANGARLVAFVEHGDEVTVTVEVRGERATARATDGP